MNLRRNSGTNLRNKPEKILVETYKEFLKNSRKNLLEAILDRIPGGVPERDSVGILERTWKEEHMEKTQKGFLEESQKEASSKGEIPGEARKILEGTSRGVIEETPEGILVRTLGHF